jgi:hypothetical protein
MEDGRLTDSQVRVLFCKCVLEHVLLLNLLSDEVGKAHPDVFSILLQIMEDGRLTDSQVSLRSCKCVLCSVSFSAWVHWGALARAIHQHMVLSFVAIA